MNVTAFSPLDWLDRKAFQVPDEVLFRVQLLLYLQRYLKTIHVMRKILGFFSLCFLVYMMGCETDDSVNEASNFDQIILGTWTCEGFVTECFSGTSGYQVLEISFDGTYATETRWDSSKTTSLYRIEGQELTISGIESGSNSFESPSQTRVWMIDFQEGQLIYSDLESDEDCRTFWKWSRN